MNDCRHLIFIKGRYLATTRVNLALHAKGESMAFDRKAWRGPWDQVWLAVMTPLYNHCIGRLS